MGILYDDVVIISQSDKEGDPCVITVNCPDKTGLGCDLCRIILFFGLSIVRGGNFFPHLIDFILYLATIFLFGCWENMGKICYDFLLLNLPLEIFCKKKKKRVIGMCDWSSTLRNKWWVVKILITSSETMILIFLNNYFPGLAVEKI